MPNSPKIISILLMVAAVVVVIAGVVTWVVITDNLAAEKITVSGHATCAAGDDVNGPMSAFCMAQVIDHHGMGIVLALVGVAIRALDERTSDAPVAVTAPSAG